MFKSRLIFGVLATLSFAIAGCVSMGPQKKAEVTVGMIVFRGAKYPSYESGRITLNGVHTQDIEITLMHIDSERSYAAKGNERGLFYIKNLPAGNYMLIRARVDFINQYTKAAVTWSASKTVQPVFEIVPGKVNNLGQILWESENRSYNNVTLPTRYDVVKTEFSRAYPNSEYAGKEWTNCVSAWGEIKTARVPEPPPEEQMPAE